MLIKLNKNCITVKKKGRGRPRKISNIEIKTENLPASQAEQNATPNLFEDPEEALKQLMEMQSKVKQEFDDEPSIVNFNYEEDDFLDENIENIDEQLLFQDLELQILKDLEDNELNMQLAFDD